MGERYTEALKENLIIADNETRERIMNEWRDKIFLHNDEIKEYLKLVYADTEVERKK